MYSRSHGFAEGISGPNDSAEIFAAASVETNNVKANIRMISFLADNEVLPAEGHAEL